MFLSAAAVIFDKLGTSAIYTPSAGDAVSCTVVVQSGTGLMPMDTQAQFWGDETHLFCLVDECGEPDRGETFTVGSTTYTVDEVLDNNSYVVEMRVRS
jgi:hypothetical protein